MYAHCIYCSSDLGRNEVLEAFPVGRRVAFDAARGRLWAVCPRCARWNLAPFEERWEPVEAAERAFRDARLRAHSENVGLARLADGTGLIRVGEALPGEMAAWRYGATLALRRRRYLVATAAAGVAASALIGGMAWAGMGGMIALVGNIWRDHQRKQVVHRVPGALTPDGRAHTVRRWHVEAAWLGEHGDGVALHIPDTNRDKPKVAWSGVPRYSEKHLLVLTGEDARRALSRSLVRVNERGGGRDQLRQAVEQVAASGPEALIRETARAGHVLGKRQGQESKRIRPVAALALEMALHEEDERRALAGELAVLEAAWREAEEIARIADGLAFAPAGLPARAWGRRLPESVGER